MATILLISLLETLIELPCEDNTFELIYSSLIPSFTAYGIPKRSPFQILIMLDAAQLRQ